MYPPVQPANSVGLLTIEGGLTLLVVTAAVWRPRWGQSLFKRVERTFLALARRKTLALISVGVAMIVMRLAILPSFPTPLPTLNDDFAYLFSADTFMHGRLANPTPPMWIHFETVHLTMTPTYTSMYFPGPGLVMAAGKVILGYPWAGILLSAAIMCSTLCWMLQAWLPPGWALLGGVLAILRLALFSYWVNTYTGGATLTVTGSALVLGAMPRLVKTGRFRYGMLMAAGIALLGLTRPYEGFLLCLPVAIVLCGWIIRGKSRPPIPTLLRRAAAPVALLVAVVAWLAYYDARAFGKPTTLPYTLQRDAYAVVPYYVWQPLRDIPVYRHDEIRRFYTDAEPITFIPMKNPRGFAEIMLERVYTGLRFFCGFALLPAVFMFPRVVKDRRLRFLVICLPFWFAGMSIVVFFHPHYVAAFTPAFYAIGLQGMRHLRFWKVGGYLGGTAIVRGMVTVCLCMAALRLDAERLHLAPPEWPFGEWLSTWVGPTHIGRDRARIEDELDRVPGKHLVLVQYSPEHESVIEWVYNSADIDASRTIWAHDMGPEKNEELIRYYKDRDVWLVQPDEDDRPLTRYSACEASGVQLAVAR